MSRKSAGLPTLVPAEKLVRDIRRTTHKRHSSEDNIRDVLEGLGSKEGIEKIEN